MNIDHQNRYDHNHYDVSGTINVADPCDVNAEVNRIYLSLYPGASTARIDQALRDIDALYAGRYPGYHASDTEYHDIQHVLDVSLAMTRLMGGHDSLEPGCEALGAPLFCLGIVLALFHDCGYLREISDTQSRTGGELTLTHVSRGVRFLKQYLPRIGMADEAETGAMLLHFTGYEIPVAKIPVTSRPYLKLGRMLGSADLIAQMADRCYLEKCRDRLYPEFLAAGIARKRLPNGEEDVVYESGDDLVMKTPSYSEYAMRRLEHDLDGCYAYAGHYFGGQNLYLLRIDTNLKFAQTLSNKQDTSALKRGLPLPVNQSGRLPGNPALDRAGAGRAMP